MVFMGLLLGWKNLNNSRLEPNTFCLKSDRDMRTCQNRRNRNNIPVKHCPSTWRFNTQTITHDGMTTWPLPRFRNLHTPESTIKEGKFSVCTITLYTCYSQTDMNVSLKSLKQSVFNTSFCFFLIVINHISPWNILLLIHDEVRGAVH